MTYDIMRKDELPVSKWSGGTTTQLAIFPEGVSYAARSFVWRVSTARVDAEESEFTPLPGVWRALMVLEGALRLEHGSCREAFLRPFDVDTFSGGEATTSHGRATDFNLMITEGQGGIGHMVIAPETDVAVDCADISLPWNCRSDVFYIFSGSADARMPGGETIRLNEGDVLVTCRTNDRGAEIRLSNSAATGTTVAQATIFHN